MEEPEHPSPGSAPERAGSHAGGWAPVLVVTVDDRLLFRAAAREVIDATPGFRMVGEAGSGEEALSVVDDLNPHLVLLDVRMPGIDGVETARRLTSRHPGVVIFLVSVEIGDALVAATSTCGAAALLRKQDLRSSELRRLWQMHGGPG